MEITSISTIACIVPSTQTEITEYSSLKYEKQELKFEQRDNEYQLSLLGKLRMKMKEKKNIHKHRSNRTIK